jgi:hypothetical protein
MFCINYDAWTQFCQHGSVSCPILQQTKVATSPLAKAWIGDHQGIYPQLAKSQIACTGDSASFSLSLQKSYNRSGDVSMFIHTVTLLSGIHASAVSHMVQEMEVDV